MIVSHSRKFCYWKIARTGSNTAELCIRLSNILDIDHDLVTRCHFFPASHNVRELESGHTTPTEAIKKGYLTQEQYDEYDHYTLVREPISRWVSAYAYRCLDKPVTPQEFFDDGTYDLVARKQSDYIDASTNVYDFADYANSIRNIVCRVGGNLIDVPRLAHKTERQWQDAAREAIKTTRLGDQLRDYYSDDSRLYERERNGHQQNVD